MKSFHSKMMLCDVIAEREAHLELVEHPNEKHGPSRKTNMDTLGILGTLSSFRIAYSSRKPSGQAQMSLRGELKKCKT